MNDSPDFNERQSFHTLNQFFANLATWSFRNRWLVLALSSLVLGLCVYLAQSVRMDNSFEAFFDANDPAYNAYTTYRESFGSDEIIYLMYDASTYEGGVFNKELMGKIPTLANRIDLEVPFVDKVRHIGNAELMRGENDDLIITKIENEGALNQAQYNELAKAFAEKDLFINSLFDKEQKLGAILIDMTRASTDPVDEIRLDPNGGDDLSNLYPQVSDHALREILNDEEFASLEFFISGDVPLNAAYNDIVFTEMGTLGGLTFLIIAVVLGIFFRGRIIGVIGPLMVVGLALMMTVAFISAMNWQIDMMFGLTPTLLTAIGVAHAVHIISEFLTHLGEGKDREEAIFKTFYLIGTPCLLTSLTTAIGFLAMSSAPIKTISHMAIYMSLGVLFAFFLSVSLLSFFLTFLKAPKENTKEKSKGSLLARSLSATGRFTIANQALCIFLFIFTIAICGAGIYHLKIDSNYLSDFSNQVPVKVDTQHIDNTMGGMNSFVYLFDSGDVDGIKTPEFLREVERVQKETEKHFPLIRKTTSIVDLIKDINQSFHGGDPSYYKIPDSKELISQYFLVYEFSGGEDLNTYVSTDYRFATLQMRVQITETSRLEVFDNAMQDYFSKEPLVHAEQSNTGMGALWLTLTEYISTSQIRGLSLALLAITIVISLIYGSFKMGLISMIPNIGPILVVGGFMGWFGIHLDFSKLLIATVAIGIAVDDTIHMMTRFKLEFDKRKNYHAAFQATIEEVGKALVITSITLVLGWSALLLSVMDAQFWFAILLSSTVIFALIADFFVMPILVFWLKPFGPEESHISNIST